jgi:hypothetical protein
MLLTITHHYCCYEYIDNAATNTHTTNNTIDINDNTINAVDEVQIMTKLFQHL